jgi:hypothetical protein
VPVRNLGRLALVLVILYLTMIASSILPFQPRNPAWQIRMVGALVNGATLPLVALVLLQVGTILDPRDPLLKRRQRRFSQFAAAAALGFLLLCPLQIAAGVVLQNDTSVLQARRLTQAEEQLARLREAAEMASSGPELSSSFQKLGGPTIPPADLALPLPLLKDQVRTALDQVQRQLARQRSALPVSDPGRLLPEQIRGVIACLATSYGFLIFAARPGKKQSMLEELRQRVKRSVR